MQIIKIAKDSKKIKLLLQPELNSNNYWIIVKGPLGEAKFFMKNLNVSSNKLFLEEKALDFFLKKVKKLIHSVITGWFIELNLNGLGYKSFKLDDKIALDLGYSNLITYKPTSKIKIKNFKNKIILFSTDQEYLNNVAFTFRKFAQPDAYKGKGILFKNEVLKLKKKSKN